MRNVDKSSLNDHLKVLGPKLGWHVRSARFDDLTVTLPEADLRQIEKLAEDPIAWTMQAAERTPVTSATTHGLVNVTLDMDGYKGRSHLPVVVIVISAIALALSVIVTVICKLED